MRVTFTDLAPSEGEFFEEYDKYTTLNAWFILLFILRSCIPFCLGLQITSFEDYQILGYLQEHYGIIGSKNNQTEDEKEKSMFRQRDEFAFQTNTYQYIGFAIGNSVGGVLADLYGRRISAFCLSIIWNCMSWILIVMPNLLACEICMSLLSVLYSGINTITFVNFAEIASKRNRFLSVFTLHSFMYAVVLINYGTTKIRDWQLLSIFVSSTTFITVFACWYIPESPRWLWNKDKKVEVFSLLSEISGVPYDIEKLPIPETKPPKTASVFLSMIAFLFRNKLMHFTIFSILTAVCSIMCSTATKVLAFHFQETPHFTTLMMLPEIASCFFIVPVYVILGKLYGIIFIHVSLASCNLVALVLFGVKREILFNIFQVLLSLAARNLIWLYMLEVFPTFIRATVIGFSLGIYGIMGILSGYLVHKVDNFWGFNYYIILFVLALLGSLALFLPKSTSKKDLPNHKL